MSKNKIQNKKQISKRSFLKYLSAMVAAFGLGGILSFSKDDSAKKISSTGYGSSRYGM